MNNKVRHLLKVCYYNVKYFRQIHSAFYSKSIKEYKNAIQPDELFKYDVTTILPCIEDKNDDAGSVDPHYFLQDIWMVRQINKQKPQIHYDIGSRIDGFIAHMLTQNYLERLVMIDIRPFEVQVDKLDFIQSNATSLDNIEDETIESLSCLHAVEHFGLGRYGDPVEPRAWRNALNSMERVIKKGGYLYLSVPIGKTQKLCFNAHRIFHPQTIVEALPNMRLVEFAYLHDMEVKKVSLDEIEYVHDRIGNYDCGLFVFRKEYTN